MSCFKYLLVVSLLTFLTQGAFAEPMEIYCTIRSSGDSLNCQLMGKERKVMNVEEINNFLDAAEVAAYITLKSRKGLERSYMVDARAPLFKKLNETKKSASISEISKAKSELFNEIEKKVIKISDNLDSQYSAAELVLFDSSYTFDKLKRETRAMQAELDGYRKNKDKVCTNTPAFEKVSKTSARLQQTLSNILYAFQTPDGCMSEYKVFKDRDGSVDLRQLDTVADHYKANCHKR